MSEHDKKTEKEFPSRLKAHPYILESDETINRGRLVPKTDKESPSKNLIPTLEKDPMLKLAAVLKNWKKRRRLYWMKFLMYCFFVAYVLLAAFPVYLAWTEKWTFSEGYSIGFKILLTAAMTSMAVFAIVAGRGIYKKWARRQDG